MTEAEDRAAEAEQRTVNLYLSSHDRQHADEAARVDAWRLAHKDAHAADQRALDTALASEQRRLLEHATAHEAAHANHLEIHAAAENAHISQHQAEDKAVALQQATIDERLHKANELRALVNDQAKLFATVVSFDALEKSMEQLRDEMRQSSQLEREERRQALSEHALVHRGEEGQKRGIGQSTAVIVGAITLSATVLGVVIVIINFVTGTP